MIKKFAFALGVTTICSSIDPTAALPRSAFMDEKPGGPRVHRVFKTNEFYKKGRKNRKTKSFKIPLSNKTKHAAKVHKKISELKEVNAKKSTRSRKKRWTAVLLDAFVKKSIQKKQSRLARAAAQAKKSAAAASMRPHTAAPSKPNVTPVQMNQDENIHATSQPAAKTSPVMQEEVRENIPKMFNQRSLYRMKFQ